MLRNTMGRPKNRTSLFLFILTYFLTVTLVHSLTTKTYNPQTKAMFPTAATLVFSEFTKRAIQFDAEFTIPDGRNVLENIKLSRKELELIIISCGDPDYYFGLQPIVEAYPNVKIVASKKVVDHITKTKNEKFARYAPILKGAAPTKLYDPEVANSTIFTIDGQPIYLRSENSYAAYYWIPYQKTIFGGVGVSSKIHVFTADTQTCASRAQWRHVLREMIALQPRKVIPGHYLGNLPHGDEAIKFTLEYLETYEAVLKKNNYKNSTAVIKEMKEQYSNLGLVSSLELGAKVNTGEIQFSKR